LTLRTVMNSNITMLIPDLGWRRAGRIACSLSGETRSDLIGASDRVADDPRFLLDSCAFSAQDLAAEVRPASLACFSSLFAMAVRSSSDRNALLNARDKFSSSAGLINSSV
jgi:hypothetical protein